MTGIQSIKDRVKELRAKYDEYKEKAWSDKEEQYQHETYRIWAQNIRFELGIIKTTVEAIMQDLENKAKRRGEFLTKDSKVMWTVMVASELIVFADEFKQSCQEILDEIGGGK